MPKSLRTPAHAALMASLIEHRRAEGMTQQQLADALQRPQSFVAKIETGERRLDVIEFAEITFALNIGPESILEPVLSALRKG